MSNLKVKVIDSHIETRNGVSTKTGKPYTLITQPNVVVEFNNEVRLVPISLQDGHVPFSAGDYFLDPIELIQIGRFGFELNRFKQIELQPVQAPKALFNAKTA